MIRRPPRSTLDRSSAASDVYKRQSPIWQKGTEILIQNFKHGINTIEIIACSINQNANNCINFKTNIKVNLPFIQRQSSYITIGSVSYTHLRAHETVLDLVCRLLLEKKKSKKKKTHIKNKKKNKTKK